MKGFTPLQIMTHLAAWAPLGWLVWDFLNGNLTVNPIQAATQRTVKAALILLVLSLACTPLNTLTGYAPALKLRRPLGVYAFLYAALHFMVFIILDYNQNWRLILQAILEKRFVIVGLAALMILLPLAITSFQWWQKKMGKTWKRLHRLVYLAGGLVIFHYAWAVKGDIFKLSGDVFQPLVYGLIVLALLALRLPPIRRSIVNRRRRAGGRQVVVISRKEAGGERNADPGR